MELKLSITLSGLVYFVPCSYGERSPPYNCNTKYTSPVKVVDNFNSKAKTLAIFSFVKIKSAKFKVARFLPNESIFVFLSSILAGSATGD